MVGLVLPDIIPLQMGGLGALAEKFGKKSAKAGYFGALMMGVLFALAFCPYSGVLYFGMLIRLTVASPQGLWRPPVYAVATGLPVIVFAWIIAFAIGREGTLYNRIRSFELWFRRVSAVLFVITGVYLAVATWF